MRGVWLGALVLAAVAQSGAAQAQERPFAIVVRDAATGQPVPCVTLRTVHQVRLESDRNGIIAFFEPGLMDREVWFETLGPPWEMEPDWLGFPGRAFLTTPGGEGEVLVSSSGAPPACGADDGATRLVADGLPALEERHGVRIVDAETGRGVPLVELRAGGQAWVSDSAGWIAVVEPGWLGEARSFDVVSHGFESTVADLQLERGGRSQITIRRQMPAERLYRVTGGGIYRDSALLGEPSPLASPLLNAQVVGLDSTHTAVHDGRLFWVWGDTLRPSYPLGHFKTAAATSWLPQDGGLPADVGVDLTYFAGEDGFSRGVADISDVGLIWTSGLVSVPSDRGAELVGSYVNVGSEVHRLGAGLVRWDPSEEAFETLIAWPAPLPAEPTGTAFLEGEHLYFTDIGPEEGSPFGAVRVPASISALADPSTYETFTATDGAGEVQRRDDGGPAYAWRAAAPRTTTEGAGMHGRVRDAFGSVEVSDHMGSVFWNDHVGRYLRIFARPWGDDAFLGEAWMATADTPMGPWAWARQVVTHDEYSFYNPRQHPEFDDGALVYFEGTYSATFSGNDRPTARYDYNQVMYRVDLDAVPMPVAVYGEALRTRSQRPDASQPARFFALEGPAEGAIALRWTGPDCEPRRLSAAGQGEVAFWALESAEGAPDAVGLFEIPADGGGGRYSLDSPLGEAPIGFVWPNPVDAVFPLQDHPTPVAAMAGPDVCAGSGPVRLRGQGSSGASLRWLPEGEEAAGAERLVEGDGVHVLWLEATDEEGRVARDVVVVRIGAPPGCGCSAGGGGGLWLLPAILVGRRRSRRVRRGRLSSSDRARGSGRSLQVPIRARSSGSRRFD